MEYILNQTLPNYTLGESSNKRLGTERMGEISIKIPIKDDGFFDFKKQEEIAKHHEKIKQIKEKLMEEYKKIFESKVKYD